ncbi:HPt (histidine-containing phosphotransfer) domain-containing protein [Flavobacterium sp. CG_23.5]|jgi:HPt (histidine-containing phosphotransfer) domain-containing protein|uniref:Hpt domain-containing protein n=1 Tax=unclassified Flavobacterium TaxID=196869 RepID=UPI0018CAD4A0|nr:MULTISPECIES: Hpt domain-containing protein [unclassified Flavobacterium]MBG6111509.1 HPt (histidine-containing phosphotransfer) domain-containing protein [Flavobacterium sp. CG_9.10]MBP2282647.1 HPt (histidine-containing phosphotransfer) domain-containing protein [Flavobacterium sp. CG_23.5]
MALKYNLSKVYALSDNDPEFVNEILTLFVTEVPEDLMQIKEGIKKKDHKHAYAYAHKIKPTLDLLGLNVAFEEILQIEAWTKAEGKKKEIKETFKSVKTQINDAIKEIKKDFDL